MVTCEFWLDLHHEFQGVDVDTLVPEKEGEAIYAKIHGERLVFSAIRLRVEESIPFARELVTQAKDPGKTLLVFNADEVVKLPLGVLLEQRAAFTRRVAQMEDDIRDSIIIELKHVFWQFQPLLTTHLLWQTYFIKNEKDFTCEGRFDPGPSGFTFNSFITLQIQPEL